MKICSPVRLINELFYKKNYFFILLKMGQWIECVVDTDYEINTKYPYNIRRKSNKRVCKEWIHKTSGYIHCKMNGKAYQKHRVIALQFIENDDPNLFTIVDHKDQDRTNNHINNLRWTNHSQNMRNMSSYNCVRAEYVNELPEDFIEVILYNGIEFENYYYYDS